MTSDKHLHANRAIATKSPGPRSQAGKARSRLNSRKHGLTAKMLIIVGENADDFDQLRAELMAEHDPQSVLETELGERLAGIQRNSETPRLKGLHLCYSAGLLAR
jgi:hypothetical protein